MIRNPAHKQRDTLIEGDEARINRSVAEFAKAWAGAAQVPLHMILPPPKRALTPEEVADAQTYEEHCLRVLKEAQKRKVEVRHRGRWCLTNDGIKSIKKGDEFRMYEPDGRRVLTPSGSAIHRALEDARQCGPWDSPSIHIEDDIWGVKTEGTA